jgi:hypothetical protein
MECQSEVDVNLMKRKYQSLDVRRIREYDGNGRRTKSVIIDGVPPSICIFYRKFTTSIDFDMDLHLYENHRSDLFRLPIANGLYFSLDSRIEYAIHEGKKLYEADVDVEAELGE